MKAAWSQVGDLGHEWEQVARARPLRVPTPQALEDALAHGADLVPSVSLQTTQGPDAPAVPCLALSENHQTPGEIQLD